MKTVVICMKRAGNRKSDGRPYLMVKCLLPVGSNSSATGWEAVDQYLDPRLNEAVQAVPGVYEYDSETVPIMGRLTEVFTHLKLVSKGFPSEKPLQS